MRPRAGVRPTTHKVLEALFAILDGMIGEWAPVRVLDAFAGAGQLGFEALERGADSVIFVEIDGGAAHDLKKRAAGNPRAVIMRGDAREVLGRLAGPFDLVLLDPPYSVGLAARAVDIVGSRGLLADDGVLVAEHHHKDAMPSTAGALRQVRVQRYGETALSFYRRESTTEPTEGTEGLSGASRDDYSSVGSVGSVGSVVKNPERKAES